MVVRKADPVNSTATIESTIHATWPLSLALVIVVYAAFLALVFWLYWSERGGSSRWLRGVMASLRFLLLVVVVWMLAGWSLRRTRTEPPELVIAVDVSESMLTTDAASSTTTSTTSTTSSSSANPGTRLARAGQLLQLSDSQLSQLQKQYQLRLYAIAEDAMPLEATGAISRQDLQKLSDSAAWQFRKDSSRLGDGLNRIIQRQAGRGTAAIVFLSDGITTAGSTLIDSAERARRAAIPIHAITLGRQAAQPDLRVADILCEDRVYFGDRVTIAASVAASEAQNQTAKLSLIDTASGRVLDQKSVDFSSVDGSQNVQLEFVPDKPGTINLKVTIESLPNENNAANNSVEHTLIVENRIIKALLVFGNPSYEFRFLKHFLERSTESSENHSSSFQLMSVLQDGDLDYVLQDSSAERFVPSDVATLADFDVFIFGQFDPSTIPRSSQQAIVRSVTQGGAGCVFVAADGNFIQRLLSSPLSSLLPIESASKSVEFGQFSVASTKLGEAALPLQFTAMSGDRSNMVFRLPPIQSIMKLQGLKPGAQVLAEAVATEGWRSPLLVSQFAGAGRSVLIATDETYRWTGAFGSDTIHQTFWGQTLRWLSRGKLSSSEQAELSVEPKQSIVGTPVRLRLRLPSGIELPESTSVRITGSDGSQSNETLLRIAGTANNYQTTLSQLSPGNHRAVLTTPTLTAAPAVEFSAIAPPGEQANLRADSAAMKKLAMSSRGRYFDDQTAASWLDSLPPGRPTRLGSLPPQPIWNTPWLAALFVGLLTTEWLLRRYARML